MKKIEYANLKDLLTTAVKTGRIYAGIEAYKMFAGLPSTEKGDLLFNFDSISIRIIENELLDPFDICSV